MQPSTMFLVILQAQSREPNYWLPILFGAIMGIGLAWWLRRKK